MLQGSLRSAMCVPTPPFVLDEWAIFVLLWGDLLVDLVAVHDEIP